MYTYLNIIEKTLKTFSCIVAIVVLTMLVSPEVWASSASTSSGLPYEGWLMSFQKSLTGPVAFSIALAGIIGCGASLVFLGGEMSRFLRSMVYILLVMTLIIGADTVMTNFFNASDIGIETSAHHETMETPVTSLEDPVYKTPSLKLEAK